MLRMFFIPVVHRAIRLDATVRFFAKGTKQFGKMENTHLNETMLEANKYNLASAPAIVHQLLVVYCLR